MTSLEEYFRRSFEHRLQVHLPAHDGEYLTPATRLLEKRREMQEIESALSSQKEEFQLKMEALHQRREELNKKEYQLKESLLRFDKFLKENDSKRARADVKTGMERSAKEEKMREMLRLIQEHEDLKKSRAHQKVVLTHHVIFQDYLDTVLEKTDEFGEIREFLARHDTLTQTNTDLVERQLKNVEEIEHHKGRLVKFTEEKNNEILSYNNALASLQRELDDSQSRTRTVEVRWNNILNTTAKKTLLLGQIKMATHNLFTLVNRHLTMRHNTTKTIGQLDKIDEFIQDLSEISGLGFGE
jgi:chromosome segregation ATPase